jgi:hypothetical protein
VQPDGGRRLLFLQALDRLAGHSLDRGAEKKGAAGSLVVESLAGRVQADRLGAEESIECEGCAKRSRNSFMPGSSALDARSG